MPPKTPKPEDRVYVGELADRINREIGTIRKWEREGKLPKKLLPKRGDRGWRYWTHAQATGIEEWMKKNDMRPGKSLAHQPKDPDQHVRNLRRPKYTNKHFILLVKAGVKNKATAEEICAELYPHTKYASAENMEAALRRYFKKQGWFFPPVVRQKREPPVDLKTKKRKKPKKPEKVIRPMFRVACPECSALVDYNSLDAHMKSDACSTPSDRNTAAK